MNSSNGSASDRFHLPPLRRPVSVPVESVPKRRRAPLGSILVLLTGAALVGGADAGARNPIDWLLNIDRAELPHGADWRLEYHWLPTSWQVFAVLGAALAAAAMIVFLYVKEGTNLSPVRRIALASLRLAAVALAFVVLVGPNVRAVHQVQNESIVLVLVDTSASMKIQDKYLGDAEKTEFARMAALGVHEIPETPRIQIVNRILANTELRLPERLAARNDVRFYAFDRAVREVGAFRKGDVPAFEALDAQGLSTDLSSAIQEILERQEGNTEICGVVVVSDGQFNQGPPPFSIARAAGARQIPVWVVGLGDVKSPKSLSLLELVGPERVFVAEPKPQPDTFVLRALLAHRGMKGGKVDVLLERAAKGGEEFHLVHDKEGKDCRRAVEFVEEGIQPEVSFEVVPDEVGEFEYRARIDDAKDAPNPLGPEVVLRQARLRKTVRVIDRENRVLLVSGTANYEYRILKTLLVRDKDIQLYLWLQSATKGWPQKGDEILTSLETQFEYETLRTYDCVIFIDVNPRDLTPERVASLDKFLTREGGGLVFICGEAYTHQTLTDASLKPLLDMLPVIPDADPLKDFEIGRGWNKEWRVRIPEGEPHEILQLADDERDTRDVVAGLLPFYWYFPVVSEKPLARKVLVRVDPEDGMVASEHNVMMAFGYHGPGRVLFLATDSTYLWRSTNEAAYDKFWIGVINYLIQGRLFGGQKRASITMTGDQVVPEGDDYAVPLGGRIEVRVEALDSNYVNPLEEQELRVEFQHRETKDRWSVQLLPNKDRPGEYRGIFHPALTGQHVATLMGFSEEEAAGREILVHEPQGEVDVPELNRAALVSMLQMNREGLVEGGWDPAGKSKEAFVEEHYLDTADELEALPDRIESRVDQFQILGKRQEVWSSPLAILLFTTFVGLEWFFRKRANLV